MNLSKSLFGLITAGAAMLALSASANSIALDTEYTSILPSATIAGDSVTVNWEVSDTLNAGVYTYEYQLVNGPMGAANLDFLSVTFNTSAIGSVLAGNYTDLKSTGVDWKVSPLPAGASTAALNTAGVLYFTSLYLPALGPADASDSIPPSPFVSGDDVGVPNVPDGGLTVAFVGFALVGVEGVRRKLLKK